MIDRNDKKIMRQIQTDCNNIREAIRKRSTWGTAKTHIEILFTRFPAVVMI